MSKNKIILLVLFVILASGLIFYYSFLSKSPSPPLTEEQRMQLLVDMTTAPADGISLSAKELKRLVDLTTAPAPKR